MVKALRNVKQDHSDTCDEFVTRWRQSGTLNAETYLAQCFVLRRATSEPVGSCTNG